MKRIKLIVFTCIIYFFVYTIQIVVVHKFVNPIATPLMIIRVAEGLMRGGNSVKIKKEWRSLDKISRNMVYAVIAAEDFTFFHHNGFNWSGIRNAFKYNEKHKNKKVIGNSTISQQTAKNVFLYPSRTWIRKGLEAYFTVLIELIWSKERILEVYLNIIEVGDGVYGVEAGSEFYFNLPVSKLTAAQATSLAAILPDPLHWSPIKPTRSLKRRIGGVRRMMLVIERRPAEYYIEALDGDRPL